MTTAIIGRWGNANALRIPFSFCEQLGLTTGSSVDMSIEGHRLIIKASDDVYTLKGRRAAWDGRLFKTQELDWGDAVGGEAG